MNDSIGFFKYIIKIIKDCDNLDKELSTARLASAALDSYDKNKGKGYGNKKEEK